MRCLYLTQELAPYFSVGGLSLVAASLPQLLASDFCIEHTIVLPYYPTLVQRAGLQTEILAELPPITIGQKTAPASVHRITNHHYQCEILLIRSDMWYQPGQGIYHDDDYNEYPDAVPRSAFFGACIAHWLEQATTSFDIIHGNDWQSAIALFLLARKRCKRNHASPRLLYNINNGCYQGRFSAELLPYLGLDDDDQDEILRIAAGQPSMMLLALMAADRLVTCSPSYSEELSSVFSGTSMADIFKNKHIVGIISGVDTAVWNPQRADSLTSCYTADTVESGKYQNKRALQRHFGLRECASTPVYGICSRLVPEKGIELILEGLKDLVMSGQIQLVTIGAGLRQYREDFQLLVKEAPDFAYYQSEFTSPSAHLLYAGCDFTLMPSLFEPGGQNQLIAMHYGTIPIVNAVGGLRDTVIDVRCDPDRGNGFCLQKATSQNLCATVSYSASWLQNEIATVIKVRKRMMQNNWSWRQTAKQYAELYYTL